MSTLEAYELTQTQIRQELKRINAALLDHDRNAGGTPCGHDQAKVDELTEILHKLQTITKALKGA